MMKLRLLDVQRAQMVWNKVSQCEFDVKVSFKVMRLLKELTELYSDIETIRADLVKKLGDETEGRDKIKVKDENIQEFHSQMGELLQEEVELQASPFDLDMLSGVKLTPADMMALEPFLKQDE